YKHHELDPAPVLKSLAKPSFMIKIIPHVDCTPRICELVRYYLEGVTLKGAVEMNCKELLPFRKLEIDEGLNDLNSGIADEHVESAERFEFAKWKKLLAILLDGAFLTTRAALRQMYKQNSGSIIYMGSIHSKEASVLKAPYVTAKHGLIGLSKVVAKEGAAHGVRSNVICPGFVRTPLVEKQIPEQAKAFGITEQEVIKNVMLKETVDGQFTTVEDIAETALFFAAFPSNALTGQSLVVTHGWFME
ncbi:MAG: SDR family oxidoreductase, partial [Methylocella sp.]